VKGLVFLRSLVHVEVIYLIELLLLVFEYDEILMKFKMDLVPFFSNTKVLVISRI